MDMNKIFGYIIMAVVCAACDVVVEPIGQKIVTPEQSDPEAYAAYMEQLNAYKESEHYIVCALFDNSPDIALSEQNMLRSLPDSLDIIICRNSLSEYDIEDLTGVQRKGTKILLNVNCSEATSALRNMENAVAVMNEYSLDGLSINFYGRVDGADSGAIIQMISNLSGKILVFQGNPAFVKGNMELFDYFLLDEVEADTLNDVQRDVDYIMGYYEVHPEKVLPIIKLSGKIQDVSGVERMAYTYFPTLVKSLKMGGITVCEFTSDYYHSSGIWLNMKNMICNLNPSHK